jgi:hypothetical protein
MGFVLIVFLVAPLFGPEKFAAALGSGGKPNSRVTSRQTGNMFGPKPIHIRRFAEGSHPDDGIRAFPFKTLFQNQIERQPV